MAGENNRDVVGLPSSMASLKPTAHMVTGLLIDLLRRHFSSNRVLDPGLREFVWQTNPGSPILIEHLGRWDPQQSGNRASLIVKRNSYAAKSVGINQGQMKSSRTGDSHHARRYLGSSTVFCLARELGTVERLSEEVLAEIDHFAPVVRHSLSHCLKSLETVEVGAASEVEESEEVFVVPVVVGYLFEQSWVLQPQATKLKIIELLTHSEA